MATPYFQLRMDRVPSTQDLAREGLGDLPVGASLAVNGVCLTAVSVSDDTVTLDIVPETLQRTNLGELEVGGQVNLERPMPAGGRFDGHIVQGHVDGVGTVTEVATDPDGGVVMTVQVPEALLRYLVEKGSVTIDGVSLTVAALTAEGFTVALIPATLAVTTLRDLRAGDPVNLEGDPLGKRVQRWLAARAAGSAGV